MSPFWLFLIIPVSFVFGFFTAALLSVNKEK